MYAYWSEMQIICSMQVIPAADECSSGNKDQTQTKKTMIDISFFLFIHDPYESLILQLSGSRARREGQLTCNQTTVCKE